MDINTVETQSRDEIRKKLSLMLRGDSVVVLGQRVNFLKDGQFMIEGSPDFSSTSVKATVKYLCGD